MTKSTAFANDLLAAEYDTGASGTLALGPVSARVNYTLPILGHLTTTACSDSAPGTEVTGGSYSAQSLAGKMGTPSAKSVSNTGALTYSNMPSCTLYDFYTSDSSGTPKYMSYRGGSSMNKVVNAGDTVLIPAASLTGAEV